jgi:TonB family protein
MKSAGTLGLLALLAVAAACGSSPPPEAAAPAASASAAAPPDTSQAAAAPPAGATGAPSADQAPPPAAEKAPAAASATASASAGPPDKNPLTGKISQQTIMDLVVKNQALFNDCYTIGAGKSQHFVATVTVKASIGPTGSVNGTQIAKSTAKNPKVDQCVAEAFKKMKFPATGSTVPITFPMEFNGAEQVK